MFKEHATDVVSTLSPISKKDKDRTLLKTRGKCGGRWAWHDLPRKNGARSFSCNENLNCGVTCGAESYYIDTSLAKLLS